MMPPLYNAVAADAASTALLDTPPRLYPHGEAPQDVVTPYAAWATVSGFPENYLASRPDTDYYTVQIDVFADSSASALAVAKALRDVCEGIGYVAAWRGESRDPETRRFRYSFDVDFITPR